MPAEDMTTAGDLRHLKIGLKADGTIKFLLGVKDNLLDSDPFLPFDAFEGRKCF